MANTWLVFDVSYLAYRALYTTGDLSHEGVNTGVVFGMFQTVMGLQDRFGTDQIAWCFDAGHQKRSQVWSKYKTNRKPSKDDDELRQARGLLREQLGLLRTKYLPFVGFPNVFWQDGYEADDMIASVCEHMPRGDLAVIVSSDHDMYQLLSNDRVIMFNPQKKQTITQDSFGREHGIDPTLWADVLAIAGCVGDGVEGVKGVGEVTAVKFLTGRLKSTTKAFVSITRNEDVWRRNLFLTRLPFRGTRKCELKSAQFDSSLWDKLLERLGMKSLIGRNRHGRDSET